MLNVGLQSMNSLIRVLYHHQRLRKFERLHEIPARKALSYLTTTFNDGKCNQIFMQIANLFEKNKENNVEFNIEDIFNCNSYLFY